MMVQAYRHRWISVSIGYETCRCGVLRNPDHSNDEAFCLSAYSDRCSAASAALLAAGGGPGAPEPTNFTVTVTDGPGGDDPASSAGESEAERIWRITREMARGG